ncbi:hypothetical protein BM1374166_01931 [Bartonella tribocorum]|nr:hypothetical protein BM1374166_01931 [Bartonella tribocorum]
MSPIFLIFSAPFTPASNLMLYTRLSHHQISPTPLQSFPPCRIQTFMPLFTRFSPQSFHDHHALDQAPLPCLYVSIFLRFCLFTENCKELINIPRLFDPPPFSQRPHTITTFIPVSYPNLYAFISWGDTEGILFLSILRLPLFEEANANNRFRQ